MKARIRNFTMAGIALGGLLLVIALVAAEGKKEMPRPKVIELNVKEGDYLPLLKGAPESLNMHSGLVILAPGKSVGKHSTKEYEELLVILEGKGEMLLSGGEKLLLNPSVVAYCPPRQEHDVVNTGDRQLRYIYVVAKADSAQ